MNSNPSTHPSPTTDQNASANQNASIPQTIATPLATVAQPGGAATHGYGMPTPHDMPAQYGGGPVASHATPTGSLGGLATAYTILVAGSVPTAIFGAVAAESGEQEAGLVLLLLALMLGLTGGVLFFVLLHKMWGRVPAAIRTTTPGAAVGLMFVPFFNLYWQFRAIVGLSQDLQKTTGRGAGAGVGIAACVTACIPYVNMLVAPILLMVWANIASRSLPKATRIG